MTTQEKLFRRGQLHVTAGLPASKIPGYRALDASPLVEHAVNRSSYLVVKLQRPPLNDLRVRRALALAIDRTALAGPVFHDAVTPTGRYVPAGLPGYEGPERVIGFSPDEARRLLADAGYPQGQGFPAVELLVASGESGRVLATAVRRMWQQELGISVTAASQEYQVYINSLVGGDFDLAFTSWNGGSLPSGFLDRWVTGGGTNDSRFSDPQYDRLIEVDARSTSDEAVLMDISRRAEDILLRELPIIPLFQAHVTYLVQPAVQGLTRSPLNTVDFRRLSLADTAVGVSSASESGARAGTGTSVN